MSLLKSWKKTCVECGKRTSCAAPCKAIKRRLKGMEPVKHTRFDKQGNVIEEKVITASYLKSRPYRRQNQAQFRVSANKTYDNLAFVPKRLKQQVATFEPDDAVKDIKKKFKIELNPRGILYYHIVEQLKARQDKPFIKFPRKEVPIFYDQENYYLLDIYFHDYRIAVEVDGKAFHNKAYDDLRDKRLKVLGITTLRYPARTVISDYTSAARDIIRRIAIGIPANLPKVQEQGNMR